MFLHFVLWVQNI